MSESGAEGSAKEAIACGADQAFTVANPILDDYQAELYLDAICTVFQQSDADILVLPFDRKGKDLIGRVATRISASAITEVVDFKVEAARLSISVQSMGTRLTENIL